MFVTLYRRHSQEANFSIERLFADICKALPGGIDARIEVSRFVSRGLWKRMYNIVEAAFRQGDVNHITGDVHFLALLLRRDRTVLTIHDLVSVHRLRGVRRRLFLFWWYWLPIKRSAVVTVVSHATKEDLLRHIDVPSDKLRVIYNCFSPAFRPDPKAFNDSRPVILQVGTGTNKNLDRVAESLQGIPCHFRILGRIDERQGAILQRFGLDYSSIADLSDEAILEEYRRSDMLVFASTYEGFGLPIIEAQATGRPVVTSNLPPMSEVSGDAACLVDPFDAMNIREGIQKVIQDSGYRENMVRLGFDNIERFRAEHIAGLYADLYREVAACQV